MSKHSLISLLTTIVISFIGCTEKNTEDPIKAYTFWAGEPPSKEIKLLHGKYWESAHFSKEYEMWLEFEASRTWIVNYIQQNKLIECEKCDSFTIPPNAPFWFNPDKNYKQLIRSEDNWESMYFYDSLKSKMFIYEIQL